MNQFSDKWRRVRAVLAACMGAALVTACGGGGGGGSSAPAAVTPPAPPPDPDPPPVAVDLSFCDAQISVVDGIACVIQPSKTDAAILDQHPDSATNPNPGADQGEGYGYHVVVIPSTLNAVSPVHVHFHGTYTRPYDQNGLGLLADANGLHATVQVEEAAAAGFMMIQLAYPNRTAVNVVCADNKATDNCAGLIRQEKLLGVEQTPLTDVDLANSIEYRLLALLRYLEANLPAEALPVTSANVTLSGAFDWSTVRVGGHSQGSGHAFYIAKNFGVQHACLLGGPFDVADEVPDDSQRIADWYLENAAGGLYSLTPADNLRGLIVTGDPINNGVEASYRLMGLTEDSEWINLQTTGLADRAGNSINSHAAAAKADEFSAVRARLCFTDTPLAPGEFTGL
ncbi:MAG: hypothetical protein AAFN78_02645 [Pseudomonadota bacterium]